MTAVNPHARTEHGPVWDEGYEQGLKGVGGMFGQPPHGLSAEALRVFKEGFKHGRTDAKNGVKAPVKAPAGHAHEAAHEAPGHHEVWNFTIDGHAHHNVTTEAAKEVLVKLAQRLERRVEGLEYYQVAFNESTSSHVMKWIIESASGFHYEPDMAVWKELKAEVSAARAAAAAGHIPQAAREITGASKHIEAAAENWAKFLDNFNRGGDRSVHGLEHVVKACITIEAVGAGALTGGVVAGAAIGAGNNGLNAAADEWFAVLEGHSSHMDFHKISIDAGIGLVLGGAGGHLGPKWEELMAKQAPRVLEHNLPLLEKVGAKFINHATGHAFTGAEVIEKLAPHWTKVVTMLPATALHNVVEELLKAGLEGEKHPEAFAHKMVAAIHQDVWEHALETVLKEHH